jgi:hypothetical protein
MNSQREGKRRLVYLLWAVVAGLVILGALPTFIGDRWPRALADDSVYLMVHQSFRTELWRFGLKNAAEPERHPWVGQMLLVPPVHRVLNPIPGALWELISTADTPGYALVKRPLPSLTEQLRVPIDRSVYGGVIIPDGQQLQLLVQDVASEPALNAASQIAWVDATGRGVRQSPSHCDAFPRLLPPLHADEALLLCASELWAVRPDGQRPLLTAKMEGSPCYRYAGRPFGVGRDPERQRLLVTGDGGALCQIDLRTDRATQIATLPIQESERVPLDGVQFASATDLLYIGTTPWDRSSEPQLTRILAWDLKANRLRTEITLSDPLVAFRPTSDGGHLVGLVGMRWESDHRLVLIDVATGKVTQVASIPGGIGDWDVMDQ